VEVLNQIQVAQRLHEMGIWLHSSYLFNQGDRLSIASHSKTVVLKESSPLMRSRLRHCLVITPLVYKDSYKGTKCLGSILTLSTFLSCSVLALGGGEFYLDESCPTPPQKIVFFGGGFGHDSR
jgi:hypothetical protein